MSFTAEMRISLLTALLATGNEFVQPELHFPSSYSKSLK